MQDAYARWRGRANLEDLRAPGSIEKPRKAGAGLDVLGPDALHDHVRKPAWVHDQPGGAFVDPGLDLDALLVSPSVQLLKHCSELGVDVVVRRFQHAAFRELGHLQADVVDKQDAADGGERLDGTGVLVVDLWITDGG